MRLYRAIHHVQRNVGNDHLYHGDLAARCFVAHRVHHVRRLEDQQTRLFDFHARRRDVCANRTLFGDFPAECNARIHALAHGFERAFGHSDQTHAMMDSSWPQPPLRDFETAAFAQQHVRNGHADILERNFRVTVGRMIVAEYREHALHLDARCVHRHQNHRLLFMFWCVGIGLAHENRYLAAWIACAGRPPLSSIDNVGISVAHDVALDIRRVGRCHGRLRHGKTRTNLAIQQRLQPALLVFRRTITRQHFHVARIRRGTIEYFRRHGGTAHDLAQRRVFQIRQPGPVFAFRQEQIPEIGGAGFRF